MRKIHVLQVSAFFPSKGGGIEVVAHQISKALCRMGFCVAHIASGIAESDRKLAEGYYKQLDCAGIDFLSRHVGLPMPILGVNGVRRLWKAVGSSDAVHLHDYLYMPCLLAFCFAKIHRKPIVITQHIGEIPFSKSSKKKLLHFINKFIGAFVLRRCNAVAFVSGTVKSYYERLCGKNMHFHLIQNGVDTDVYKVAMDALSATPVNFLFVGRFVEKKGIHLLRQCIDLKGVHWTFIGDGALSPEQWPEANETICVVTGLRGDDVVPFYQRAHLLVLPSVGEGFPLVVQEALACGTPVLVSDEVEKGFLKVDPSCVFSVDLTDGATAGRRLCEKLSMLANDAEGLLAARARASALARQWSWQVAAKSYADLYLSVCHGR